LTGRKKKKKKEKKKKKVATGSPNFENLFLMFVCVRFSLFLCMDSFCTYFDLRKGLLKPMTLFEEF